MIRSIRRLLLFKTNQKRCLNINVKRYLNVFTHIDHQLHQTGENHPECSERIDYILQNLKKHSYITINNNFDMINDDLLLQLHDKTYLNNIMEDANKLKENEIVSLGVEPYSDTMLCKYSLQAAKRAAGSVIACINNIYNESEYAAFACMRPPGHHAEYDNSMGFCFYGNVALGALYAINNYNIKRVAIIDFDVHHGNGTQHLIENNEQIFYASTHEMPLFPGTGNSNETGLYENVLNVPLAPNTSVEELFKIYNDIIIPKLNKFQPQLLMFSAGFDAHKNDPLSNQNMEAKDYYKLTKMILNKIPVNHVVSVLEGGYNLQALSDSCEQHCKALHEFNVEKSQ